MSIYYIDFSKTICSQCNAFVCAVYINNDSKEMLGASLLGMNPANTANSPKMRSGDQPHSLNSFTVILLKVDDHLCQLAMVHVHNRADQLVMYDIEIVVEP